MDAVVDLAIRDHTDPSCFDADRSRAVASLFFLPKPGRLRSLSGLDHALQRKWPKLLESPFKPGDLIESPVHHGKRAGIFLVDGPDRSRVLERIDEIYPRIEFVTE